MKENIMSNVYTPDGWVILKIQYEQELIYKIFASWYGGYLQGDSWKLNSGIVSYSIEDNSIIFNGYSKSIYRVTKNSENEISGYNTNVLYSFLTTKIAPISVISFDNFQEEFKKM